MIEQIFTEIGEAPLRSTSDNETEYRNDVEAFLTAISKFSKELKAFVPQANATEKGINSVVTNASSLASQITILRNEVVAKAAEIKSYVIPTSAINTRRIRAMQILN